MEIHILRGDQQSGPFSEERVKAMLQAGTVQLADLVWHEELSEWKPLHTVLGIPPTAQSQASAGSSAPDLFSPLLRTSRADYGRPAPFILRLCAGAIDSVLLLFAVFSGWGVLAYYAGKDVDKNSDPTVGEVLAPHMAAFWLIPILIIWLYIAVLEGFLAQGTLGKMALGLVVTDLNGERITFSRASKRVLGMAVSVFTLGTGFLMCIWTTKRQCLHDFLSGCLVLKRK